MTPKSKSPWRSAPATSPAATGEPDVEALCEELRRLAGEADALLAVLPEGAYLTAIDAHFDRRDYFGRCSKPLLAAHIEEMRGAAERPLPEPEALAKMKKKELAELTRTTAEHADWLPAALRHPEKPA